MRLLLVIAFVALASVAGAQTTSTSTSSSTSTSTSSTSTSTSLVKTSSAGVLVSAQSASGPSGGIVCFSASAQAARVLVLDIVGSSSPSGTVQVEHSTAPNTAGTWVILSSPSFVAMTPAVITTGISFEILNPVGCYRTNFTALSSGTYAVSYQAQE
jgi:hypothetical protein